MHVELSEPQDQDLLVRGLAHRMNNILTVFHGYVGLMLENDKLDASTRDGLARIKAGARAATELIDRANSLVRQPTVVWRQVNLIDFVEKLRPAIDSLRPDTKGVVQISLPESIPAVETDSGRLRSALLEIIRNAFEATSGQPTPSIAISLSVVPPPALPEGAFDTQADTWVSLAVTDNGPGIGADVAQKIFQPFFSTKRKTEATGLGLNVAKGLIQQCGGILRHESKRGRTQFELLLPARQAD